MDVVILSASPNDDGLTAACAAALHRGVVEGGGRSEEVRLNDFDLAQCQACDRGWGTCRTDHRCQVQDDFQSLHNLACKADAIAVVTPVYFGQMSESAKAFTDRFRRCEATRGDGSCLNGKPVILVAAAGGSGGGTITCLLTMENWSNHVRARVYDLIPVKRWTREHKLVAIRSAASGMVGGA